MPHVFIMFYIILWIYWTKLLIVAKAFRYGFYWPSALQQAEDIVQKCEGCQRFANKIHMPASALKTIPITWPFAVWC